MLLLYMAVLDAESVVKGSKNEEGSEMSEEK